MPFRGEVVLGGRPPVAESQMYDAPYGAPGVQWSDDGEDFPSTVLNTPRYS